MKRSSDSGSFIIKNLASSLEERVKKEIKKLSLKRSFVCMSMESESKIKNMSGASASWFNNCSAGCVKRVSAAESGDV